LDLAYRIHDEGNFRRIARLPHHSKAIRFTIFPRHRLSLLVSVKGAPDNRSI
jgi:hypothetical protein